MSWFWRRRATHADADRAAREQTQQTIREIEAKRARLDRMVEEARRAQAARVGALFDELVPDRGDQE